MKAARVGDKTVKHNHPPEVYDTASKHDYYTPIVVALVPEIRVEDKTGNYREECNNNRKVFYDSAQNNYANKHERKCEKYVHRSLFALSHEGKQLSEQNEASLKAPTLYIFQHQPQSRSLGKDFPIGMGQFWSLSESRHILPLAQCGVVPVARRLSVGLLLPK